MNAIVPSSERAQRLETYAVTDPNPALDTPRFEQMQRVATIMARSSLVPDSLVCRYEGTGDNKVAVRLPLEEAVANCFLVTNQSVRWGMDPFAVAQCCSVVHGRLMYEGKLVHAVLQAKLGLSLEFEWNDATGDALGIKVIGTPSRSGRDRIITGTVGGWKTTKSGSPWSKPSQVRQMLAYRGSREWVRLYEPALLLGVYTHDELEQLEEITRGSMPRGIAGPPRSAPQIEQQPSGADQVRAAVASMIEPGQAERAEARLAEARAAAAGQARTVDLSSPGSGHPAAEVSTAGAKATTETVETVNRERGKPSPGKARRTKEEIAEDEAAWQAEATANAQAQGQAGEEDQDEAATEEALRQAEELDAIAKDAGEQIEAAADEATLDEVAETLAGVDLPRSLREQIEFTIDEKRKRIQHKARLAELEAKPKTVETMPQIDRNSEAYKRGLKDYANGLRKCLSSTIKADPVALANWQAAQDDSRDAEEAGAPLRA